MSTAWRLTFASGLLVLLTIGVSPRTLHAAAEDSGAAAPQWVQANGLGGVSGPGLFLASDRTLYLVTNTALYRLTETADGWTRVRTSGPGQEFDRVMAEHGDTLYLLTATEIVVSTDRGSTWRTLCPRPKGRAIALVITPGTQQHSTQGTAMTIYLVLKTEVFRSEDAGQQWEFIGHVLRTDVAPAADGRAFWIWDALAVENTLFVGTSYGLFRFTDTWKRLPVHPSDGIKSLAVAEERLYVGTLIGPRQGPAWKPHAAVLYSTDLGDSWTDITPSSREHPVKLIAAVEVVPVGETLIARGSGGLLLSYDRGQTWVDPKSDSLPSGAFPLVALDESNFFAVGYHPPLISRSTDGGTTWHPLRTGLLNSHVSNVATVGNVLYAFTDRKIATSTDKGESWEPVNLKAEGTLLIPRVRTTADVLYVSSLANNRTQLFHLAGGDAVLEPVPGVPDFEEDNLYVEWKKKLREAREMDINAREIEQLWRESLPLISKEDITNGGFAVTGDTVFMEHRRKLFRWSPGETAWHYTGLEDRGKLPPIEAKGLTLAASGNIIYAGKREGTLLRSFDDGDTWEDITPNLAFPFTYFKAIVFAGSTVYVSTDAGVMRSDDGETWHALTEPDGNTLLMDRIIADGSTLYGVCNSGVYRVEDQTRTWKQVAPAAPYPATSFAMDGRTLYIGTAHSGVLRFQRGDP